jgi:hypothetical protein
MQTTAAEAAAEAPVLVVAVDAIMVVLYRRDVRSQSLLLLLFLMLYTVAFFLTE